jgi:hypothetical protein
MKIHAKSFKNFDDLEAFFMKEILPNRNLSSKVIGKKILYWPRIRPSEGGARVLGVSK